MHSNPEVVDKQEETVLTALEVIGRTGIDRDTLARWRRQSFLRSVAKQVGPLKTVHAFPVSEIPKIRRMLELVRQGYAPRKAFKKTLAELAGSLASLDSAVDTQVLDRLNVNVQAWLMFTPDIRQAICVIAPRPGIDPQSFADQLFDSPCIRSRVADFVIQPSFKIEQKIDILKSLGILRA